MLQNVRQWFGPRRSAFRADRMAEGKFVLRYLGCQAFFEGGQ